MSVIALEVPNGPELVRCEAMLPNGATCLQVIAHRWPNGVKSVAPDWIAEQRGALRITCPACRGSRRVYPRKQAA